LNDDDVDELPQNLAELPHAEQIRACLRRSGLKHYQRMRIATADGNPVDRITLDMVLLLNFHVINPGSQSFFQTQFERKKFGGRQLRPVSSITCMQLWTESFDKLGMFMLA
jgi:hypothetical protein